MCKKPSYESIIDTWINGNRKDFAFKVKQFGLADFISRITAEAHASYALELIGAAVRLGGYK